MHLIEKEKQLLSQPFPIHGSFATSLFTIQISHHYCHPTSCTSLASIKNSKKTNYLPFYTKQKKKEPRQLSKTNPLLSLPPSLPLSVKMASQSLVQFIEAALWCTGPFELSYTDPDQKWLIRKDMLSLLQGFPNLSPSMDTYIHGDGTIANLLNAHGTVHISSSSPQVPLTIWLHENYPYVAPIVFVGLTGMVPSPTIHHDHPFVDPSGLTTSPYIRTWQFPRCNLKELVHNLVKIFSRDHPFSYSATSSPFTHSSVVSKEALDRLEGMLHYDTMALRSETDKEVEKLLALQQEMDQQVKIVTAIVQGLKRERWELRDRMARLAKEADVLINWLKVHDPKRAMAMGDDDIDDVFEGVDEESRLRLQCLAADLSIEDTIYALDKAVDEGAMNFEIYIRQVRNLAREQFFHRAMVVKFETSRQLL